MSDEYIEYYDEHQKVDLATQTAICSYNHREIKYKSDVKRAYECPLCAVLKKLAEIKNNHKPKDQ